MMMPRIFSEDLFDDFMMLSVKTLWEVTIHSLAEEKHNLMKTDIKEKDGNYILDMDLPGCKKEDVALKLEKRLSYSSRKQRSRQRTKKMTNGNYIRQERYSGSCQRSFYVGENVEEKDIKAKFESGILHIELPA